jgi:pimeloyl-ACP methyl ester carboxylesterase
LLNDPDTNLYKRDDIPANSVLIPFYWGYRAARGEIKRDVRGDPTKLRTQYQDIHGNRLDANFGKPGGHFVNATNNIPDMYGAPFKPPFGVSAANASSNYLYVAEAANRRYMVFAAERLATLIATMRTAYPSETITVIGHSQGTVITLLAQALLADRNQRCADCIIMVASPYSLVSHLTPAGSDTFGTLLGIVEKITAAPYPSPSLDSMRAGQEYSHGRAGPAWNADSGQRIGKDGKILVFPERDNRGKVYLYFSPNDTTVALDTIAGIGTYGVPEEIYAGTRPQLMTRLSSKRFYQRMWTKRHRDGKPVLVGTPPGQIALRVRGEPAFPGDNLALGALSQKAMVEGQMMYINGEELFPQHAPQMFAGEALKGTPATFGKDRPDAVTQNIALGKDKAKLQWVTLPEDYSALSEQAAKARFNALSGDENDHTQNVRKKGRFGGTLEREQTPNEARDWMKDSSDALAENSYHSAVLRDPENHRWVTAMDIALGQANSLDSPDWRALLVLMADWRMDQKALDAIKQNPLWNRLEQRTRDVVGWCFSYYKSGVFPPNSVVEMRRLPALVKGSLPKGVER